MRHASRAGAGSGAGAARSGLGDLSRPDPNEFGAFHAGGKAPDRRDGPALARLLRLDSVRGRRRNDALRGRRLQSVAERPGWSPGPRGEMGARGFRAVARASVRGEARCEANCGLFRLPFARRTLIEPHLAGSAAAGFACVVNSSARSRVTLTQPGARWRFEKGRGDERR